MRRMKHGDTIIEFDTRSTYDTDGECPCRGDRPRQEYPLDRRKREKALIEAIPPPLLWADDREGHHKKQAKDCVRHGSPLWRRQCRGDLSRHSARTHEGPACAGLLNVGAEAPQFRLRLFSLRDLRALCVRSRVLRVSYSASSLNM
jgi:hypothetical protein